MKLTAKQQRFVDAWDGNATAAAKAAGYKGNDVTLQAVGSENLRKPLIAEAIKARELAKRSALIKSRQERQEWWSKLMDDQLLDMAERLRASELLAKSEGDFIKKVEVTGKVTIEQLVTEAATGDDE